jgi:hypothetical protein
MRWSLSEWDRNRGDWRMLEIGFRDAEILCPECTKNGTQSFLKDESDEVLTTFPARVRVYCPVCGWRGTRIL